jgi:hypothetical protein
MNKVQAVVRQPGVHNVTSVAAMHPERGARGHITTQECHCQHSTSCVWGPNTVLWPVCKQKLKESQGRHIFYCCRFHSATTTAPPAPAPAAPAPAAVDDASSQAATAAGACPAAAAAGVAQARISASSFPHTSMNSSSSPSRRCRGTTTGTGNTQQAVSALT